MNNAIKFRRELLTAQGCSFDTDITVDYGMQTQLFALSNQGDSMGNISFSVTYPESISGISGDISGQGGNLVFDDNILAFPLLAGDQLSPVSAPWLFLKAIQSGNILSACTEENLLHIVVDDSYEDNSLTLDIWIDDRLRPVYADILYEGTRILSLAVKNFEFL